MKRMGRSSKSLSENQAEQELTRALNESGMKDQLKTRLIDNLNETGWRDQVKLCVIDYIHDVGMENVSVEDCVRSTAIRARSIVPDDVVKDLQQEVQRFVQERAEQ